MWADYIIIADQNSTDGSREIAERFEKVILVNNTSEEMHQAEARRILFNQVDKIVGDKIVFALDADEFLSVNFEKTEGWYKILNSKPNSIFCFKWHNLYNDFNTALPEIKNHMEWACHFSRESKMELLYCEVENRAVHEMRIPCVADAEYINIDEIKFVHLGLLNLERSNNKRDFYQVSTVSKLPKRISAVTIFRTYNQPIKTINTQDSLLDKDIQTMIKLDDVGLHYIEEMIAVFNREGIEKFIKLDIWDNKYLKNAGISCRKPYHIKLLHWYLRKTKNICSKLPIGILDKLFKRIV